jgi:HK97 family phage major capsid protein
MMKAELKQAHEEANAEVQKLWMAFTEQKSKVENDGLKPKEVKELHEQFYEPYEKAAKDAEEKRDLYVKAIEMESGKKPDNPLDPETKERKDLPQTPGDRLVQSAQYKALQESGVLERKGAFPNLGAVEILSAAELKDLIFGPIDQGTSDPLVRATRRPGYLDIPQQVLQIRNLVTVREVGEGNSVEWVRQSRYDNQAVETPEATSTSDSAADKQESAIEFTVEQTPLMMIAHYLPVTRQALQDWPMLRDIINGTLVDGVNRRLNNQIVNGAGGTELEGILNTGGLANATGPNMIEAVFNAITDIRVSFFEPNAVLMNPADWAGVRLTRDDSGAGAGTGSYMFGPPSQAGDDTLWGKRVVLDSTIAPGTALVGDFSRAVLYVRDGISVYTTDSHSDWFTRNIIAVLAEGRFGVAVEYVDAFETATVS